ncbi:MAG: adenylate/guanylate cyclase domain-containing protein [Pseudomonadota bacterium]|nr:adenylate/guanylate cyclase domain-containing protein [Pseudomonadota bacterium]
MLKSVERILDKPLALVIVVMTAILALPVCVWLDLRNLSDQNLTSQANTLNAVISIFRTYYARNIVDRVVAAGGKATPLNAYHAVSGGIPVPATLSIELGQEIRARQKEVEYSFVSHYPFLNREPYRLSPFEEEALATFEASGDPAARVIDVSGNFLTRQIAVATPLVMEQACVNCHNTHPDIPKTDWKVGDVRGLQVFRVRQPLTLNLWAFKWLMTYMVAAGACGLMVAAVQFRKAKRFEALSQELETKNAFLSRVSDGISKYIPLQVFHSIFSGTKPTEISTDRKKLTIFFSDIKDFTATADRLQPEDLTVILNEYFTEMSTIAEAYGATIDKFIGDAIVAFFGDPTSRGVAEDAKACVAMAIAMQKRLGELEAYWRKRGVEHPFKARIGINTGICNVGNFGSKSRMDYTIIGKEANLAARLEQIAEPGGIVLSYETYALVREDVLAEPMEPVRFKGIGRDVVPYRVIMIGQATETGPSLSRRMPGMTVEIDPDRLGESGRAEAVRTLQDALAIVSRPKAD